METFEGGLWKRVEKPLNSLERTLKAWEELQQFNLLLELVQTNVAFAVLQAFAEQLSSLEGLSQGLSRYTKQFSYCFLK